MMSNQVIREFVKIALAKPNWWYSLSQQQQLDYLREHKRSKLHQDYFAPVPQISLTKEEVKELKRVSRWLPRVNDDGTCDIGMSTPNEIRFELMQLVDKKVQKSLAPALLKTKIKKLYNYYSLLEKTRVEKLNDRARAKEEAAKIASLAADNLRKLPFIKTVSEDTNFYDDPRVQARTESVSGLDTQVTVSVGPDYLQFDTISVSDADRGKGYSVKMIEAVLSAVDKISLDKPIYLGDPYNAEFWNHIRDKFLLFNWRFA